MLLLVVVDVAVVGVGVVVLGLLFLSLPLLLPVVLVLRQQFLLQQIQQEVFSQPKHQLLQELLWGWELKLLQEAN